MNSPKWIRNIDDREITSVEVAKNYIKTRILPQLEQLGFGNYTLVRKLDGQKIGTCGLYFREDVNGIDVGFALLPEYEKKGYAFESTQAILRAAFQEFRLVEINAYTLPDNYDSRQLLEKLGLKLVGAKILPNDPEELLQYQLKGESWNR